MATNQETNKLSKLNFLSNDQDPRTKLRILRTCIFPIVTYRNILKISWTKHSRSNSIS